jgi:hypothetical protein
MILGTLLVAAAAHGAPAPAPAPAAACAAERAHYVLRGHRALTADFVNVGRTEGWLTALALRIHSSETRRDYWFMLSWGSSGQITLASTTDPGARNWRPSPEDGGGGPVIDMPYFQADADFDFYLEGPQIGDPAPRYILIPDLAETLQRMPAGESVPFTFFQLSRCDPVGHSVAGSGSRR